MADKPPYVNAYGTITRALNKIAEAATPPRFTQDFLATKLGLKGGSPKPVIPFLKRSGFIGSDGVPTELYRRFRNPSQRGSAAREALKTAYSTLYEVNEYVHDANDNDLRGVVVQVTGLDADASAVRSIIGSFKALKDFAAFDQDEAPEESDETDEKPESQEGTPEASDKAPHIVLKRGLGLSYTINLNLPATSDITVFNAIFKSLKEHLLQ